MNNISNWKDATKRLKPEVWPEFAPSFKIKKSDKVFTIGSCFARNIEDYLLKLGLNLPMMLFSVPKTEYEWRPNGILNKYTPHSILQEFEWCEHVALEGGKVSLNDIEPLLYDCKDGRFIDLHIGGYSPVTKERALERRQQIFDVFSQGFSSQVLIMTVGLVEAWYDRKNKLFMQRGPLDEMSVDLDRFKFIMMTYRECYDSLQKTIDLVRKYSHECKFIITTSPIPLVRTFSGEDVIVANTYAKSVLRAVCGEIVKNNEHADYFPSYENVALTRDWRILKEDNRHVKDEFVGKIVARLAERYL